MKIIISCAFCGARGKKHLTIEAEQQIVHCSNCNYLDSRNPMFVTATAIKLKERAKILLLKPAKVLTDYASTIPFIKKMREEDAAHANQKQLQALAELDGQ